MFIQNIPSKLISKEARFESKDVEKYSKFVDLLISFPSLLKINALNFYIKEVINKNNNNLCIYDYCTCSS